MSDIRSLLQARYGSSIPRGAEQWPERLADLLSHRSVRSYLPDPLPEGMIEQMVAAAQSAATSSNLQTWSVVAVEDPGKKTAFAAIAGGQEHIKECPVFLVFLADLARLARMARGRGLPFAALDTLEMFLVASIDAALAAQNAVIWAEANGLGTVYIGSLRNDPRKVAALLDLPPRVFAVFGLCVGKAARPAHIKQRLPQEAVLHYERYRLEKQDALIDRYNQEMVDTYKRLNMNVEGDWTLHSSQRIAAPENLKGRDRLRSILESLGFPLK